MLRDYPSLQRNSRTVRRGRKKAAELLRTSAADAFLRCRICGLSLNQGESALSILRLMEVFTRNAEERFSHSPTNDDPHRFLRSNLV
jgi:hypothetical protein